MYFIHPNQISVKLPKDCDDDSFYLYEDHCPPSKDRPTSMTYLLEKLRLAHICREIADVLPPSTSKFRQVSYDNVIYLDQKLQHYLSTLPFYYKLDADSRKRAKVLEAINPDISLLRFCITRAAHTRRIKLHQRFLLRRSEDPLYGYSRQSCLESAKVVIQFYDGLADHDNPLIVTTRMNIAVHYMHLALVVLVMDLCFNHGAADEAQIKAEVREGLKTFESNEHLSPLAATFLSSLRSTLQKHKVYLDDVEIESRTARTTGSGIVASIGDQEGQFHSTSPALTDQNLAWDACFNEFWQSTVQSELNPDLATWDDLLSSLDNQPL
jgi:hypothetical protein